MTDDERPLSWRCSVCGAGGPAWTRRLAYEALAAHYAEAHT